MSAKRPANYVPYSYLTPGVDYRQFDLATDVDRVPPEWIELDAAQEQRVVDLFDKRLAVSFHDHPCQQPVNMDELVEYSRHGRWSTGYKGLAASGLDVVFDGMMGGLTRITSQGGWKFEEVVIDLGMRYADLAHQDLVYRVETVEDMTGSKGRQQIGLVPCVESTTPIENDLDRVDVLYGLGVRVLGLTYNESNLVGGGRRGPDAGLTPFGRQVVRRADQLGLAIDLSHTGDRTCLDAIEASQKPLLITHTGARALIAPELAATRMLKPDEVLRACASKGGVIGITMNPYATATTRSPTHTIESIMEHVEYCVELLGYDAVALGPDSVFADHVASYKALGFQLPLDKDKRPVVTPVEYVRGAESPQIAVRNAVRWMVRRGWSDTNIAKVMGENVVRVMRAIWAR